MSWQDDVMIEQEAADALFEMGEAEWRDIYTDISYRYVNPEVTKAFEEMDKEEEGKNIDKPETV